MPSPRIETRLARSGGAVELLRLPAALNRAVTGLRNVLYDQGWLPSARLDTPVVSVGNLTAGGTGKTPMVAWLVSELDRRGLRPGLLSRGYGASGADGLNDEARDLERLLPGVPHVQDPDRVRGGRELVARGVEVIVLDDGFQHRRLARDLDLVLVDATRPWGLPPVDGAEVRALLPRGLLREAPSGLARAGAVVITRSDQVSAERLSALRAELGRLAPGLPILVARHRPRALREVDPGGERTLLPEDLAGRRVDLISGLGNPDAFEASVRALGAEVLEHRRFPDHHDYSPEDLQGFPDDRPLVTTTKDEVKLRALGARLWVLEVAFELAEGRPVLEALLDALPEGLAARQRRSLHEGLHG